jgi:S1-C subfamily serine protease
MRSIYTGTGMICLLAAALILPTSVEAQVTREIRGAQAQARGWFGFGYSPVAESGSRAQWASVVQVESGSGAQRGGLQVGDTIVRWNGRTDVTTALQSNRAVSGDTARLRVRRDGRERDVTIVAGERRSMTIVRGGDRRVIPVDPGGLQRQMRVLEGTLVPHLDSLGIRADSLHSRLRGILRDSLGPQFRALEALPGTAFGIRVDSVRGLMPMVFEFESGMRGVAGAEVTELNPELASYFGTDRGLLVLRVAPDTPAAKAGLQAGDVVVRVNGRNVEHVRDFRTAISRAGNRSAEIDVVQRGRTRTVRMSWE